MAPLRAAPIVTADRDSREREGARALVAHREEEENREKLLSFEPVRAYAVFSCDLHLD